MKLITNTVEEVKDSIGLYIKDSFEADSVFEMKDIEPTESPIGIRVNGSIDPVLNKEVKNLSVTNGLAKPAEVKETTAVDAFEHVHGNKLEFSDRTASSEKFAQKTPIAIQCTSDDKDGGRITNGDLESGKTKDNEVAKTSEKSNDDTCPSGYKDGSIDVNRQSEITTIKSVKSDEVGDARSAQLKSDGENIKELSCPENSNIECIVDESVILAECDKEEDSQSVNESIKEMDCNDKLEINDSIKKPEALKSSINFCDSVNIKCHNNELSNKKCDLKVIEDLNIDISKSEKTSNSAFSEFEVIIEEVDDDNVNATVEIITTKDEIVDVSTKNKMHENTSSINEKVECVSINGEKVKNGSQKDEVVKDIFQKDEVKVICSEDEIVKDGSSSLKDETVKGGSTSLKDETVKGGSTSLKDETVKGGSTSSKDETVKGGSTSSKEKTVKGGSISSKEKTVKGGSTLSIDETVKGGSTLSIDETVKDGSTPSTDKTVKDGPTSSTDKTVIDGPTSSTDKTVIDGSSSSKDETVEDCASSSKDETVQDCASSSKDETVKDGTSSSKDETVEDGASSSKDETVKDGASFSKDETVQDGTSSSKDKIVEDRSSRDETVEDGSSRDETVEDGSSRDETVEDGSSRDETVEDRSSRDEAVEDRSRDEAVEDRSSNDEAVEDRSSNDEAVEDRSSNDEAFIDPKDYIVIDVTSDSETNELSSKHETFEVVSSKDEIVAVCSNAESACSSKNNLVEELSSDTENDREAEATILTLLKETPAGLVILPDEQQDTDKDDLESDEENKLLGLLEDSQQYSGLNLLNEEIEPTGLTSFDGKKTSDKYTEDVKKCEDQNKMHEVNAKGLVKEDITVVEDMCDMELDKSQSMEINRDLQNKEVEKNSKMIFSDTKSDMVKEKLINKIDDTYEVHRSEFKKELKISEEKEILDKDKSVSSKLNTDIDKASDDISSDNSSNVGGPLLKDPTNASGSLGAGDDIKNRGAMVLSAGSNKRHLEEDETNSVKKLKRSNSCSLTTQSSIKKRLHSADDLNSETGEVKRLRENITDILDKKTKSNSVAGSRENDMIEEQNKKESKDETSKNVKLKEEGASKINGVEDRLSGCDFDETKSKSSSYEKCNAKEVGTCLIRDSGLATVDEIIGNVIKSNNVLGKKDNESTEDNKFNKIKENSSTNNVTISSDVCSVSESTVKDCDRSVSDIDKDKAEGKKNNKTFSKEISNLKKIHADKFKNLDKSDLEELIVQKICESIADRSVIGDLRLRVRSLEQSIEQWRKKSLLIEKINREMKSIMYKYIKEAEEHTKSDTRVVPIKVTRSVGLQIVPSSCPERVRSNPVMRKQITENNSPLKTAAHVRENPSVSRGSHNRSYRSPTSVATRVGAAKSPLKQPVAANVNTIRRVQPQVNSPAIESSINSPNAAAIVNKRTVPITPASVPKPVLPKIAPAPQPQPRQAPPPQPSTSSSSDMEVIDLTDRDEKTKLPVRGGANPNNMRVISRGIAATSNVVATVPSAITQRMTYLVPTSAVQAVQGNQRQQLILTTTNAAQVRPTTSAVVTSRTSATNQTISIPGSALIMKNGVMVPITSAQPISGTSGTYQQRNVQPIRLVAPAVVQQSLTHPAPLPSSPPSVSQPGWLLHPPRPILKVSKTNNGIMLSWSMQLNKNYEEIASYQLYAYQESTNVSPNSSLWKKVGDVKALPLPMACTLTQFMEGHKYHFAVRAVDVHSRVGQFSLPSSILLK